MLILKNFSNYIKKNAFTILTLVFVLVALYSYLKVYIPAKESQVNAAKFRELVQMNKTLSYKWEAMKNFHLTKEQMEQIRSAPDKEFTVGKLNVKWSNNFGKDDSFNIVPPYHFIRYDLNSGKPKSFDSGCFVIWDKADFYSNLRSPDFADCFISATSTIVYNPYPLFSLRVSSTKSGEKKTIIEGAYSKMNVSKTSIDSLLADDFPAFSSFMIKDMMIGGESYKAFLLPVNLFDYNTYSLCGLVSLQEYSYETRRVSDNTLFLISFLILLFILSMPFLKVLMMNEVDRLNSWDLIQSIGSLMIFVTVTAVTIIFLKVDDFQWQKKTMEECGSIAEKVKHEFMADIDKGSQSLVSADSFIHANPLRKNQKIIFSKKDSCVLIYDSKSGELLDTFNDYYNFFRSEFDTVIFRYFWLDSAGQQMYAWASDSAALVGGKFNTRNYFKRIIQNQPDYHYRDSVDLAIEPIISWKDGVYRTVISKKSLSKGAAVACVSISPACIANPLIPEGYGFNIITAHGDVLFSSDTLQNNNENLFRECDDSSLFTSAIHVHSENNFRVNYKGKTRSFIIKPIGTMNLYLATYADEAGRDLRMEQSLSFTFTCMLGLFIIMVFLLLLINFLKDRDNRLKIFHFQLDWLWPVQSKNELYLKTLLFNSLLFILGLITLSVLLVIYLHSSHVADFSLLLYEILILNIFVLCIETFWQFNIAGPRRKELRTPESYRILKVLISITLLLLLTFIVNTGLRHNALVGDAILILYVAFAIGIHFIIQPVLEWLRKKKGSVLEWSKTNFYSPIVMSNWIFITWLALTCALPSCALFIFSYNETNLRQTKDAQLYLANHYTRGKHDLDNLYLKNRVYENGNPLDPFHRITLDTQSSVDSNHQTRISNVLYENIIKQLKPVLSNQSENILSLNISRSYNEKAKYQWDEMRDSIRLHAALLNSGKPNDNFRVSVVSPVFRFSNLSFKGENVFYLLLTFIIILILTYYLIKFIIGRFFNTLQIIPSKNRKQLESLIEDFNYKHIFVNGIPGCGKFTGVQNLLKKSNKDEEILIVDLFTIPDLRKADQDITDEIIDKILKPKFKKLSEYKSVLIIHFEYDFKNASTNRIKLNLVERVIAAKVKKLIIVSEVDPVSFLHSYSSFGDQTDKTELKRISEDIDRWAKLLGNFYNYYYEFKIDPKLRAESIDNKTEYALSILSGECRFGTFLPRVYNEIKNDSELMKSGHDEILRRIQTYAHLYYHSIWNSLTKEEQYIVYDLAMDGLVNTKNIYLVKALHEKGILTSDLTDGKITLFNESFRNFILTQIKSSEALAIEKNMAAEGRWNNFKMPLIIIIVALIIFLLSNQQDPLHSTFTYVGLFISGATMLQRILTTFDGFGMKASAKS